MVAPADGSAATCASELLSAAVRRRVRRAIARTASTRMGLEVAAEVVVGMVAEAVGGKGRWPSDWKSAPK